MVFRGTPPGLCDAHRAVTPILKEEMAMDEFSVVLKARELIKKVGPHDFGFDQGLC